MHSFPFYYIDGQLVCESTILSDIATRLGTPVYVYSRAEMLNRAEAYLNAVAAAVPNSLVCYALKANANPILLRNLAELGLGADVTSGGELYLALSSGFPPRKIVFSGVGKTRSEIESAIDADIRAIHLESEMELTIVAEATAIKQKVTNVSVRVNFDIVADTHPHISTGRSQHKFGVSVDKAKGMLQTAEEHPWLQPEGLAVHIGSQITELTPFAHASRSLVALAAELATQGIVLKYLDVGGGLGIGDEGGSVPQPGDWIETVAKPVASSGHGLVVEPGRSIIGPAGVLLAKVLYLKDQQSKRFAIIDAGMNDLLRPALYNADHPILPLRRPSASDDDRELLVDVAGPVCETADIIGRDKALGALRPGDFVAILQTGAYGFAMSSNYNGRLRPPEVLVDGQQSQVIRERQTFKDLLDGCPQEFGLA